VPVLIDGDSFPRIWFFDTFVSKMLWLVGKFSMQATLKSNQPCRSTSSRGVKRILAAYTGLRIASGEEN